MGMREEVLKLAEECEFVGEDTSGNLRFWRTGGRVDALERFYRAATLQAAERMKEEAEEAVVTLYEKEEPPYLPDITNAIRAIDVNKLFEKGEDDKA